MRPAATPSSPPPAPPRQPDKVKVGVIAIVDVAPIYLGKQKGFFTKRNIDLTLETAQGGAAIVPGVVSGQYQFGFSNVISLLLAAVPQRADQGGQQRQQLHRRPGKDFGGLVVKDPADHERRRTWPARRSRPTR